MSVDLTPTPDVVNLCAHPDAAYIGWESLEFHPVRGLTNERLWRRRVYVCNVCRTRFTKPAELWAEGETPYLHQCHENVSNH